MIAHFFIVCRCCRVCVLNVCDSVSGLSFRLIANAKNGHKRTHVIHLESQTPRHICMLATMCIYMTPFRFHIKLCDHSWPFRTHKA